MLPIKPRPRDRYGRPLPSGSPDELDPRRLAAVRGGIDLDATLGVGAALFDDHRFFEAHEVFEALWKSPRIPGSDRAFWKGVTQVAVGLCHCQRGNYRGAVALLDRAARHLAGYPPTHCGVDTERLVALARSAARSLATAGAPPALATVGFPRAAHRSS